MPRCGPAAPALPPALPLPLPTNPLLLRAPLRHARCRRPARAPAGDPQLLLCWPLRWRAPLICTSPAPPHTSAYRFKEPPSPACCRWLKRAAPPLPAACTRGKAPAPCTNTAPACPGPRSTHMTACTLLCPLRQCAALQLGVCIGRARRPHARGLLVTRQLDAGPGTHRDLMPVQLHILNLVWPPRNSAICVPGWEATFHRFRNAMPRPFRGACRD